jgi:hypothetical protein
MALKLAIIPIWPPKTAPGHSEAHTVRRADPPFCDEHNVTFLNSRKPAFRQMHDGESLSSHVTVHLGHFLYIDTCRVSAANLPCFSKGCNKLHICTEHV